MLGAIHATLEYCQSRRRVGVGGVVRRHALHEGGERVPVVEEEVAHAEEGELREAAAGGARAHR